MSNERLDRIEAALENIQQQFDNQVEVNAELRTSTQELRTSTQELRATAEALLSIVQIHQQNFEILTTRVNEYQSTTTAALDKIGAVLDYLVRRDAEG
jgi:chromosome segregation ATPase